MSNLHHRTVQWSNGLSDLNHTSDLNNKTVLRMNSLSDVNYKTVKTPKDFWHRYNKTV